MPYPHSESRVPSPESRPVRILGIDPGSQRTGVGIVDADAAGKARHVFHTALAVLDADSFPLRLKRIYDGLCAIIEEHRPEEAAIERVFMARNPDSALKLGQARGAAICAVVSRALEVHEYAPMEIKQAVVGGGGADKAQVQHMVSVLLGLQGPLQADAADALAVAIAHAHTRATVGRIGIPRTAWRRRR
ncbi:crossover junction endodeoxyribonuclease RuvC [Mizugakiibacter sediminis]|uniref:crossover junction endodeoxyribonuclease RuvC n=1 Tax=Mizugakiibacter sediminis TaxID=1475481 RepID=UPI000A82E65A|nr:crossover junction endodeoxyribonuclease RuvC [Mizugakiibacter sediminis]